MSDEFEVAEETVASKAGVVIQHDHRGDAPYHVYEIADDGTVTATLGNFATAEEATDEANAYASAAGLTVRNETEV